jgi:hypothetical protein
VGLGIQENTQKERKEKRKEINYQSHTRDRTLHGELWSYPYHLGKLPLPPLLFLIMNVIS